MKEKINVSELKNRALSLLEGKWQSGIVVNLLFVIIFIISGIFKGLLGFGSVVLDNGGHVVLSIVIDFITAFVVVGINNGAFLGWTSSFYKLENQDDKLTYDSYSEFLTTRFKTSFLYGIGYSFFVCVWGLGFNLAGIISMYFATKVNALFGLLFITLGSIAIVAGIFVVIVKVIEYSMARYIILDKPDIKIRKALKESKTLIYGYKMNYFMMILKFIGWIFLVIVTFGIAALWVGSYWGTTEAQFYRKLKKIKKLNNRKDSSPDINEFLNNDIEY
ncbi:DUF975 family protein [Fusobacterium sp.]|uniref:DUF975 family protein n=1 Tax=Fusobacterium sp. TaxID=68766 RepID=UPI00396C3EDE